MSTYRKTYTREFKVEAVRLSYDSDTAVEQLALDLGVSSSSLNRWRAEYAADGARPRAGGVEARIARGAPGTGHPKKSHGGVCARAEVRFRFIDEHKGEYSISLMCRVLQVTRSGYYAWRKRPVSPREQASQALGREIRAIFEQHRGVYGCPRIHRELQDRGIRCGHNRVARLLRLHGLQARRKRSYKVTTQSKHSLPVAPNLLVQDFTATAPNEVWLADITYIATSEGWLYLAAVLDLYSRRIVGWALGKRLGRQLTLDALEMALRSRKPPPGLIHHSDRGSQYASAEYQALRKLHDITPSMSRRGNCYDNAPMESFFASLKSECVYQQLYASRAAARTSVFDYVEVFYNRQRMHSALDYMSPHAYEQLPLVA